MNLIQSDSKPVWSGGWCAWLAATQPQSHSGPAGVVMSVSALSLL